MQTFTCSGGNRLFFDNTQCLRCQKQVAFSIEHNLLIPLDEAKDHAGHKLEPCENYGRGLCNWFVASGGAKKLCLACRLNVEVPSDDGNETLVRNMEIAKRRLVFSLLRIGLPVVPKGEHDAGVGFALRRSAPHSPVITGHDDGLVTPDLNEADPAKRAEIRDSLGEDYRTLLGHFRHEIGHYYWTLLFADESSRAKFREVFGDERADYAKALAKHYESPRSDYADTHISSYATAHAWEDWAETWAHYLHILDGWETALSFGLRTTSSTKAASNGGSNFDRLLNDWSELMIALNSMNRSMGHDDAYPFSLAPTVRQKLAYVDRTVREAVARLPHGLPERTEPSGPSALACGGGLLGRCAPCKDPEARRHSVCKAGH
jgi:hypothetical protein